jgi:phage I-like protein
MKIRAHSTHSVLFDAAPADGAPVPTRIHLLPPSGFTGRDGRGPYFYTFEELLQAFNAYGMPLAIDYEHQSIGAGEKTGATPAAGWINGIEEDALGVWGLVEWTAAASAFIAAKEYRFISPVFEFYVETGRVLQLTGAGLTNMPNLHLVSLNTKEKSAATAPFTAHQQLNLSKHMREQLLAQLGLAAEATDADILAAVTASTQAAAHAKAAATAVGAADTSSIVTAAQSRFATDLSTYVPKTDFEAMSVRATAAEASLATHTAAAHRSAVAAAVAKAQGDKLLSPASAAHVAEAYADKPLASLTAYIATLTPVLGKTIDQGAHRIAAGEAELTEGQKVMCSVSGITEEAFRAELARRSK